MAPAPVSYAYGWNDYVVLSRVLRRENVWKRYQLFVVPVFLTVLVIVGASGIAGLKGSGFGRALHFILTSWWVWLIPLGAFGFVWCMNRIELALWYKRQRIDGVEIHIAFDDPRGLATSSKDGQGVISWGAIRKIVSDANTHVVLQDNRLIGVCLPRRAFRSDAEFAAAGVHIEKKMAENRSVNS